MAKIKLKNIEINYSESKGENQCPILLIHGAIGNRMHWPKSLRLSKEHRVYTIDLPGHGKSAGRARKSIDSYARVIVSFLDALRIESVVLVGHSMGGAISQRVLQLRPKQVKALVLVCTGARLPVNSAILETKITPAKRDELAGFISKIAYAENAPDILIQSGLREMQRTPPISFKNDFSACSVFNNLERLPGVAVPTLILAGEEDKMTPPELSKELHKGIKNSELQVFAKTGHMLPLEKHDEVGDIIFSFIQNNVSSDQ